MTRVKHRYVYIKKQTCCGEKWTSVRNKLKTIVTKVPFFRYESALFVTKCPLVTKVPCEM